MSDNKNIQETMVLDWMNELQTGNDSIKLRVIGEALVGIYANTYEITKQILEG
ncbi:hypothetical protein KAR91_24210 [Candidatus Pacearchaeota archaeon]|nr:hypothetical protein [Candidatus Pacearchaeota archaeon]